MNISIIGCGYVGLVTGACLAEQGHNVILVDIDEQKIDLIKQGKAPIYEPGLENLIKKNTGHLVATNNLESAVNSTEITFIAVGTPSTENGSIDLRYVTSISNDLGHLLKSKQCFHLIVVKSTVLPGTIENTIIPILESCSGKKSGIDFGIASNPEFLREGTAIQDYFYPDRIIIGVHDQNTQKILEDIYRDFNCPVIVTSIKTAEMIKYVSNAFLATKISFANEIGNICKILNIDSYEVFKGVGLDNRINPKFFNAGIGFGGSCFPKDVKALVSLFTDLGIEPVLLNATLSVNDEQPMKMVQLLQNHIPDLGGKRIGVLGLAFKPDTDDVRESRAFQIINALRDKGADVIAYDPMATDNFRRICYDIEYAKNPEEVVATTNAVLIVTEWPVFEELDYSGKIVIDGRRIERAMKTAMVYEGVCW